MVQSADNWQHTSTHAQYIPEQMSTEDTRGMLAQHNHK